MKLLFFSLAYADMGWFFDESRQLVCHFQNQQEQRYVIYEMRRHGRRMLGGTRTNWWGFNNSQIMLDEEKFEWKNPGLNLLLAKKSDVCLKKPEEVKSNVLIWFLI